MMQLLFEDRVPSLCHMMKYTVTKYHEWGCNGSILLKLVLIWISFFLQLYQVEGDKPCNLRILSCGQLLNDSGLCVEEFGTDDCLKFERTFNKSDLPGVFDRNGLSIQRPDAMALQPLMSLWKDNQVYPGIRVIWEPPYSESARDHLDGYMFTLFKNNTQGPCRMFKFNSSSLLRHEQLQFQYDIIYVAPGTNYTSRVYSLPSPPPQAKEDDRNFVSMFMVSGEPYVRYEEPGRWIPSVAVKTWHNGTIKVMFSRSPADLNLTDYTVMLVRPTIDFNNPFMQQRVYDEPSFTPEEPQGTVFFHHLESEEYHIVVWVEDKYHKEPGKCQCWEWRNGERYCRNICGAVMSQSFFLNVTEPVLKPETTVVTDPVTSVSSKDSMTTEEGESHTPVVRPSAARMDNSKLETYEIILIVLGVLIPLAVFLLVLLCLRRRYFKEKHLAKFCCTGWWPNGKSSFDPEHRQIDAKPVQNEGNECPVVTVPPLKKKTVYIMASRDHDAHTGLVDSFAEFLKIHCFCDVIYYPWDDNHLAGKYEWFVANINKADFIISVDSEGAAKLWSAHLDKMKYRNIKVSADDDLFDFAIKHILSNRNNNCRNDNVVHVCFGEERCCKYLLSSIVYTLPEYLPQFLQKLHGPTSKKTHNSSLPMCVKNLGELPEGANMLAAIESSAAYEKSHPDWVKERFGEPIPTYQPMPSILSLDSGIHMPYDKLMSVSNPDLTQFGASTPSPNSQIGQPAFPTVPDKRYLPSGPAVQPHTSNEWPNTRYNINNRNNTIDGREFSIYTIEDGSDTKDSCPFKATGNPQLSVFTLPSDYQEEGQGSQIKEVPWTQQNGKGIRKQQEVNRQNAPVCYKGMTILPPESVSEIVCDDTLSTALRDINRENLDADSCFTLAQPISEEDQKLETTTESSHQAQLSKADFQGII